MNGDLEGVAERSDLKSNGRGFMGQLTSGSGDVRGINAIILPVSVVDLVCQGKIPSWY